MDSLKEIGRQARPIRKYFVLAILFVGIETLFEVLIPLLMSDIIDQGILNKDMRIFATRGIGMIACAVLSLLTGMLYARYAAKASTKLGQLVRDKQFERIQKFTFTNLDHFETSGIITRLTSDVTVVQNAVTSGLRPLARGPVMLVLGLVMSFIINAKLAFVFFIVSPMLALIMVWIVKKVAPQYPLMQHALDLINSVVQENLTAIRTVKAFVRKEYEIEQFDRINEQVARITQTTFHYALFNTPAFQFCMYTTIVMLMLIGSNLILAGQLEVGQLTGILSYVLQILNSFVMLSNVFLLLTRSMASIGRIGQILAEPLQAVSPDPVREMKDPTIRFEHVSFKYAPDARKNVLSDICMTIEPGSSVGILGGTGSGKTTLVSLIPRLYDVSQGRLTIGNVKVEDYDLRVLRDKVAVVQQNNVLFSGTILDNLRWGDPDASLGEIEKACRIACVDEFMDRLSNGLETELGQGGVNVSGGQKQRLCIARALLKKPKILIFDDSTSAVDTKTDAKIREGLDTLTGMTKIIIAQRIQSVEHCDQIIVLNDGMIEASGTHAQLMKDSAVYREIYETQKRGGQDNG